LQHIEFFHTAHFDHRYHRVWAKGVLSQFIDFFWETDFDALWEQYPEGFSDALFPNIGYTYLINLGTPFVMQLENESYPIKGDGFLPRSKNMICHHTPGNRIFGVKFKVSPVLFEKKINFREYREYIFPLAYLIDRKVVEQVKAAPHFTQRVDLIAAYYQKIIDCYSGTLQDVSVVTAIIDQCSSNNAFDISVDSLAAQHGISTRTLQRYFEKATGTGSKQALQLLRIRKAVEQLVNDPHRFNWRLFGYYDYSHFYKHLVSFLHHPHIQLQQPHLQLLNRISETVVKSTAPL
jgi:AraC-like DNA-binding protein